MNAERNGGAQPERPRVLAIALDASEWTLVERWALSGAMPNVRRLYETGARARIVSTVDWLAGTPWWCFCTGKYPPDHGFLFHLQWRADRMRHERPAPDWLPMQPFYRQLGAHGRRVIAVDVPLAYRPEPMDGVEITSWSTHDKIGPTASYPPEVLPRITRELGREPITIEEAGVQSVKRLLDLKASLVDSARRQATLCESLMSREAWDFFMVGIGAAHRGGHKLWDRTSAGPMNADEGAVYDNALREVYTACDDAVGRILNAAGPDVVVLCFALHGMATNASRFDIVPEMLNRILKRTASPSPAAPSPLQRLRSAVPVEWRSAVKARLPGPLQDALSTYWRGSDRRDWSTTRAFPLLGDLQALVQINLRGREAQGIVEPGREYESLRDEIADGVLSFRDADTGVRVVDQVGRGDKLYPEARYDIGLPDLVIRWIETPAFVHRALVSDRYGTIEWPTPGRPMDGRSGHHGPMGWLVATGRHIAPRRDFGSLTVFDLNATVHHLLGVPRPAGSLGEVSTALRYS